ncbi:MAG: cupin domain-containing protein [Anaerolineales bacterium]|nr:cupin domain-containing protein [Anaerolineales bacterium]
MSDAPFFLLVDAAAAVSSIPPDSIVSRTVYQGDVTRMIVFGFAAGQELSEHTASKEALLYFVRGSAQLKLGDHQEKVGPGALVRMQPHLPHSIHAEEETVMLLVMIG